MTVPSRRNAATTYMQEKHFKLFIDMSGELACNWCHQRMFFKAVSA